MGDIERIAAGNPDAVVVVDEAYVDFGGESAIPLIARHDNVLVVQTLSKSRSLAGLRVGFAVGSRELIDGLERVKNSFIPTPSIGWPRPRDRRAGPRVLRAHAPGGDQDPPGHGAGLGALGFDVLPSAANFVFARHPPRRGAGRRERGIIVRHFRQPRIEQFLRITVGTDEQTGCCWPRWRTS